MLGALLGAAPATRAQTVGTIELGTLGGSWSDATALNDSGQVVGTSAISSDAEQHAFSWTQAGGMVDLGVPVGGVGSFARDVNANGQIVGGTTAPSGFCKIAVSWTEAAGSVLIYNDCSHGLAVNGSGQVMGFKYGWMSPAAFLWTEAGFIWGEDSYVPAAVNESGQVVGTRSCYRGCPARALLSTLAGGTIDLGTLGGSYAKAGSVNNGGQVVGSSAMAGDAQEHAFLWTPADGMMDLGTLGGTRSAALAVSDNGQVVGWSTTAGDAVQHAFSWTREGGMRDLTPDATWAQAYAVNDGGQVVGSSTADPTRGSGYRYFSWKQWKQADRTIDLGLSGAWGPNELRPSSLNGNGQVVGKTDSGRAFLWTPIDVVKATYSQGSLRVEVASVLGPASALEVSGYGAMTWKANQTRWTFNYTLQTPPGRITVCGVEACASAPVLAE
ncbi:MAG: hypothetical protein WCC48_14030 [Anaeromyxobacteraceae bacterium]